jgi:endonuclease III
MVTTRSGKDHVLVHAIAMSKATARAKEADNKTLLGPKSRAKKTPSATRLVVVSLNSRGQQKKSAGPKPKTSRSQTVPPPKTTRGRTLRSRIIQDAEPLVIQQETSVTGTKNKKVAEYIERETDAALTVSFRIKYGFDKGPAFRPSQVNAKVQYDKGFFSNKKGFKVGHQPFLIWKGPNPSQYWDYFKALKEQYDTGDEDGLQLNPTVEPLVPGHAYSGEGHKFHALVEPILSCATSNNNQKLGADNLKFNLTYRDGKIGSCPNYHRLRTTSKEDFEIILLPAGRNKQNAKFITALYHTIRGVNIKKRGLSAEEANKIQKAAEDAEDWTDGLLSLDFMVGMEMQEMFDQLVSYAGMGPKTAACVMCFSFHFAVFAVDTHIFRICQWAGWIPRNCNREDAFKFFTVFIPPELHRDLHQAIWHHAQLCFRCNVRTWDKVNDPRWKCCVCPLEALGLVRFSGWEKQPKDANSSKKEPRRNVKLADQLTTVPLKTEKDLEDAEASPHKVRAHDVDDAFGAVPELSNTKIKTKRFLYITRAEASAFRKFQRSRALEVKEASAVGTTITRKKTVTVTEDVEITTTTTFIGKHEADEDVDMDEEVEEEEEETRPIYDEDYDSDE